MRELNKNEYGEDLRAEVGAHAAASDLFKSESFAEISTRILAEAEEVSDVRLSSIEGSLKSRKKFSIDGYAFDDADESLSCFIVSYSDEQSPTTLTKSDCEALSAQVTSFLDAVKDFNQVQALQGTAYQIAQEISPLLRLASRIRIFILTNRTLSDRIKSLEQQSLSATQKVEINIWDLTRFYDLHESKQTREDLSIDLTHYVTNGVQALRSSSSNSEMETFLAVIPGAALARMFDDFGSRLLEGNVRSFLSLRGKVNKGIRQTILEAPEKFLAYNNGLSTTATGVSLELKEGQTYITRVENLQIVNGGQTTASLYTFLRNEVAKKANLDKVDVQAKLIVLNPDRAEALVPDIARFANTQNQIQDSDFFSNSPFHIRMEGISKRLNAGPKAGAVATTRWFYERARGAYLNEKNRQTTAADQRKFEAIYPSQQVITKTAMATYYNAWDQKPHLVGRGLQKNFKSFAEEIAGKYATEAGQALYGDDFYKQIVGKAILYSRLQAMVSKAEWYESGYRANIVAYTVSRFAAELERRALDLNWSQIWRSQELTQPLENTLIAIAKQMLSVLTDESRAQKNVTEYAKSEIAWAKAKATAVAFSDELIRELVSNGKAEIQERNKEAKADGNLLNEVERLTYLLSVPKATWAEVATCPSLTISEKESDILTLLFSRGAISAKQATVIFGLIARAKLEGITFP
jgi:hypothetical protein